MAVPVGAQTFEITPLAGYRFGGSFDLADDDDGPLAIKDSSAFGVALTWIVSEEGELEASYARQGTRLIVDGFFTSTPVFDLAVENYQFGGNYVIGGEEDLVRPFLGMGLGFTRLIPGPPDLDTETRFSASVSGGFKAYFGTHFGLRVELRGLFTVLESDSDVFCNSLGVCFIRTDGTYLSQGEVRGGFMVRF
jgi:hypothetical protein